MEIKDFIKKTDAIKDKFIQSMIKLAPKKQRLCIFTFTYVKGWQQLCIICRENTGSWMGINMEFALCDECINNLDQLAINTIRKWK